MTANCAYCGKPLSAIQIREGNEYCSLSCARAKRYKKPVLRVISAEPKDYMIRCLNCEQMYDGREGPKIGICSLPCVGQYEIKQISKATDERERRRA